MNKPENKRFYSKILTYFAFGVTFFTILISVFGQELVQALAQDEGYWPAINLIPILSFAILFGVLKDVTLTGLSITKKTKIIAVIILGMAIINIVLNLLFIPLFNSMGAAFAALITRIFSFAVFYIAAQKYYKIPYELNKVFLIIIAGTVLVFVDNFIQISNIYFSIIIKLGLITLYPVILYYMKFFEPIELEKIKEIWSKWKTIGGRKSNLW
jgi:O-antigen/teichoic acid export membrane protein